MKRALLAEQPHKKVKRGKVDIRIFDNDPPRVKAGKVAVQTALAVGALVVVDKLFDS